MPMSGDVERDAGIARRTAELRADGVELVAGSVTDLAGVTRAKYVPLRRLEAFQRAGMGVSPSWSVFCVDSGIAAGNPVCTAAGRAVLATIVGDNLTERAAKVGAVLQDSLRSIDSDRIGDVRGRGLAIGLELIDPETGQRDERLAAEVVYRAWELGAVVYYVGGNVLEITPPLVLTEAEAGRAAEILGDAIADAAAGRVDAGEVARYAGW
jgi:Aminotransferase class-III